MRVPYDRGRLRSMANGATTPSALRKRAKELESRAAVLDQRAEKMRRQAKACLEAAAVLEAAEPPSAKAGR